MTMQEAMQEARSTPTRRNVSRRALKVSLLLAIVFAGSLLMTVAALAQQSATYDLACWSVTTGGGGVRSSGNFRLTDGLGQNATGASASTNFTLRTGVVQNLDFLAPTPTPIVTPPPPISGTLTIHLPLINSFVAIQRNCPT